MAKPIKPFTTYSQQIINLSQNKGLKINDTQRAEQLLEKCSYYALIDGYKDLFYNPMTRKYISGTSFEDIYALYIFDEKLRSIFFKYLCNVEQRIRSLLSYAFCDTYSNNQSDYLNPNNYNNTPKFSTGISKLIKVLSSEAITNTENAYVVYQRNTYGNVPLWVITKTLTMGQLSKMYSFLPTTIQAKISTHFPSVSEKNLSQMMKVITVYRNLCAHNERLFCHKCRYEIPDTKLHDKLKIPKTGNHYNLGKSDLFSVVIVFKYLLSSEDFKEFKKEISSAISIFQKQSPNTQMNDLLNKMGFPNNWKSINRYTKI